MGAGELESLKLRAGSALPTSICILRFLENTTPHPPPVDPRLNPKRASVEGRGKEEVAG